jgi:hypothetical protein
MLTEHVHMLQMPTRASMLESPWAHFMAFQLESKT